MDNMNRVLAHVKEIKESSDIKEVAQLLHSGRWIAICATEKEPYTFSLGRILPERTEDDPGSK